MERTILSIAKHINAEVIGQFPEASIDNVSIDSRSLQNNTGTLFFAIIGQNYNAHDFLQELIAVGVQNFVVSYIPESLSGQAQFLKVSDTLEALQKFAIAYRKNFQFPIIGITGSNGKTIVKEWLNFLLSPDYNIIRSPKSYNSQVGVPLSVIGINEQHNLGIFEAGISTTNEMEKLQRIIKPSIGLLTTIGSAHDEGFANLAEKIKQKLLLFSEVDLLIYRKNKTIDCFIPKNLNTLTWSFGDLPANIIYRPFIKGTSTTIQTNVSGKIFEVETPFIDDASIENVCHCIAIMLHFNYETIEIQRRIGMLYPIEMRLKVKKGINQTTLIDDSYTADFQSLKIALDFLESQKQHTKKTVILSDIFQSGLAEEVLYTKLSQLIISNKIHRVIVIGQTIANYKNKFVNSLSFPDTDAFISHFENLSFENETILIKGARSYHFEDIVSLLEEKTHETILEINLNAISYNLNFFKSKLHPNTKMMVMVKAFGYGNGGVEIANLLEYHKVDYLGVAFADEGIVLKQNGIQIPIMVLNPEHTSYNAIIQYGLEPEIYSLKGLLAFIKTCQQKQVKSYPIHLKLDTGMHRLGFDEVQIDELLNILTQTKAVTVKSILSHMATSDDPTQRDFALHQIQTFEAWTKKLLEKLPNHPILHLLNTSGISNFPKAQFDMVRLGIGLYGVSNDLQEQKQLAHVATLKSVISQIRTIKTGESVGYGRTFVAEKTTKIATIPIGYADGIRRNWGKSGGYVLINQQKAPIVGNICMDMLMVDVSDIACTEGNAVIIFGENPSVTLMSEKLNTIPYEILTGISQRVKRIFFRE